ncbi:MAG: amidohydrolase [Synergistetes bacterium]|nr:amidohydrolase [Synergistota bacterium]
MARELQDYIVEMRRDFHMHPELKWEEHRTAGVVESELKRYGYDVKRVVDTGVVAVLHGKKAGSTVALRADMDALPIKEETGLPYASQVEGKMHACGHDAHTAMLLAAAQILSEIRDELEGSVKLVFQPAEEGGWGAERMVTAGVVDDVDAIFGMHIWATMPSGVIGIKAGALLASVDSFEVSIRGKGGHGAEPYKAIDPIVVAVDLVNAYQKIVTREVAATEPVVISVTTINGGSAFNIVPEEVRMLGTIRTLDEGIREFVVKRMEDIAKGYATAMRCDATLKLVSKPAPPIVNDAELAVFSREVLSDMGEIVEPDVAMIGEDFSFYGKKTRSMFLLLGTRNEEKGIVYPHHHSKFDVDEDVLYKGSAIHAILAYEYLKR